jgi:hypothetical protein
VNKKTKGSEQDIHNLGARKPKGMNRIYTICYGDPCLREEHLSINNKIYMI